MSHQAIMQQKYPSANLVVYGAFMELCRQFEPEPQKGRTHEHHICPKKQFPELEHSPKNLITLYTELHMHAHRLLGAAVPELRYYAHPNWIACASENGRKTKTNGTGVHAPGAAARAGRIGGRKNVESGQLASVRNVETQSKGGRIGGRSLTREQHQAATRIANHKRWHVKRGIVNPTCSLCVAVTETP